MGATVGTITGPFAKALDAASTAPAPPLLQRLRGEGRTRFQALGLPDRRQEAWRQTRLKGIIDTNFEAPSTSGAPRVDTGGWRRPDAHLMVFVDGIHSPDLSAVGKLPDGVVVSSILTAAATGSNLVERHLGSLAPQDGHPFAALNTALLTDGALLWVPDSVTVEEPIQLLFVTTGSDRPTVVAPRLLIVAGDNSRLTVEEHHAGGETLSLSCPVTELVVGDNASVEHVVVQDESRKTSHLAVQHVRLCRNARYTAQSISLGADLARSDISVVLDGEGAEARLDGLYLTDGTQQADSHLTVRHARPHCASHQLYKGVLGGRSRSVFTGKIIVDQDAQKTDARQSNRNLILSDAAVANSNPQLEIFADDVRCTHGSTVGRLDEDALFYLQARGIGRADARQLLIRAFTGEILDRIAIAPLRERLEGRVGSWLADVVTAGDQE